jgi:hypothetical protein
MESLSEAGMKYRPGAPGPQDLVGKYHAGSLKQGGVTGKKADAA